MVLFDLASGLAGGVAGVVVGHPFDTAKVKLQTQDFRNPQYRGTLDCFSQIARKNGVRGLYQGMASPAAGVGVINATVFAVQRSLARRFDNPNTDSSQFISGICGGFVQSFIACPTELAKTQLQIQSESSISGAVRKFAGPMDCVRHIYKTQGLRGVFRGQLITSLRDSPSFGIYFWTYFASNRLFSGSADGTAPGPLSVFVSGGLAGAASWFFTYPIDVIKTRMQSDGIAGPARYSGIVDCVRTSVKEEGLSVLSRGLGPTMMRSVPTNAATFLVVSMMLKYMCPESDDTPSDTQQAIQEIYTAAETIVNAAEVTVRSNQFHQTAVRKFQENQLKNLLVPILQAAAPEESDSEKEMGFLSASLCSQDTIDMLLSTGDAGILDFSAHWVKRGGVATQTTKPSECLLANQQMLSLLL